MIHAMHSSLFGLCLCPVLCFSLCATRHPFRLYSFQFLSNSRLVFGNDLWDNIRIGMVSVGL